MREIDRAFVDTYRRTVAAEEGRIISHSKALKEFKSPIHRGIYEYLEEPRPNNGLRTEGRVLEVVTYGTK